MRPPETLRTDRLLLRPPTVADAAEIFRCYARDPEVTRYVTWRPHPHLQETERFLRECVGARDAATRFPYVVTRGDRNELIGMVEIRVNDFKADLGYVVARPQWGQGFATEAVRALVDWAFGQSRIYRVWGLCDVENLASVRVLEKVGMVREGLLRRYLLHPNITPEPRDCYCYARTR